MVLFSPDKPRFFSIKHVFFITPKFTSPTSTDSIFHHHSPSKKNECKPSESPLQHLFVRYSIDFGVFFFSLLSIYIYLLY